MPSGILVKDASVVNKIEICIDKINQESLELNDVLENIYILLRYIISKKKGRINMKNNWEIKTLGEICEIVGGGTPKTEIREYWSDEIVWVTPKDLGQLETVEIFDTAKKISKKGLEKSSAKLLPQGSVVMSSRAPIGYVAIAGVELATNQGCRNFVCGDKIFNKYLYYFLTASTELLNSLGGGATFKEISGTTIKSIQIPFPPLAEQKRIVKILDEKFGAIEELKRVTEQQIVDAKELFESRLNETVLSSNYQKWITCDIGKVVDLKQGLAINSKTKFLINPNGSLPLLRIKDLKEKTEEIFIDGDKTSKEVHVYPDDVIYTRTGQVGLVFRGFRGILHNNSFKVTPEPCVSRQYLFWYLQSKKFFEQVTNFAKRAAQPDISHKSFKTILISFPESLKEQEVIAKELDKLLEKTKELEAIFRKKITDLDELKKSYLEQAFSGNL